MTGFIEQSISLHSVLASTTPHIFLVYGEQLVTFYQL